MKSSLRLKRRKGVESDLDEERERSLPQASAPLSILLVDREREMRERGKEGEKREEEAGLEMSTLSFILPL